MDMCFRTFMSQTNGEEKKKSDPKDDNDSKNH